MTFSSNSEPNNNQNLIDVPYQDNQLSVPERLTSDESTWQTGLMQLPQEVIQNLSQATSEEEILTTTVEEARRVLDCERVVVYSLSPPSQGIVVAEAVLSGWTKLLGMTIKDPCFKAKYLEVYEKGRVKVINDVLSSGMTRCYIEQLKSLGVQSIMVAPLLKQGKVLGLLIAHQCSGPRAWQPEEIDFFSQLGTYAGFVLDNAQLLDNQSHRQQQAETETKWAKFFIELSQYLYHASDREDLLAVAVEEVRRVLNCERVVVYSLNQDQYGEVIAESVERGWTKALGVTIIDPCFETRYLEKYRDGRVRALDNIYEAGMTPCYVEQLEKLEVKANLVAPIVNQGNLFGLLVAHQCSRPRAWQQHEMSWVAQVAAQVGLALEQVQIRAERDRLQQQSETEAQWTHFLTDAIQYIRQSLSKEDILKATVREMRRVLNCERVVVYSLNQERYGVVVAESVAPGWTRALDKTIKDPCFEAKYLDKYRNGRVRAWENIYEAGMTQCYIDQLEKLEVKANLVTPILNEGKLFGLLVAHQCSAPRQWQQHEIRWVTQLSTQVGFALDNASLLAGSTNRQQADGHNQWMQSLQEFIRYLRQYSNQSELLETTVDEARRVLNCERVVVYGLNRDYYGKVIAESVAPGWTKALGLTIQDPCFEIKYMEKYQNGRVKALDDIYAAGMTACYLEQLEKLEVKANLVTPILIEDKIFGLLVAHYCSATHKWQSAEIDFLSQLATQVGLGLERAELISQRKQLEKQTENEVQWTQFFTQAVQYIRQSLQQKDILNITVDEVRRVLRCERVVVYSLNQDRYGEVIAESVALGWTRALGVTIKDPCFEARYLEMYRDGRVRALDNIYEAGMTSCYLEQLEKLEVKANLVTPILNEGKLFGLLVAHQCSAPRQWQQYEIRWTTQIATQVGFALDNAKLLQQLEKSSLTVDNISRQQNQQTDAFKQQVMNILSDSTTAYQTLSQEALRQSETVVDVLHQIQEMSDAVRGQVVNIHKVKLQEQQTNVKVQLLQETLNQTLDGITAIQDLVNDVTVKFMRLSQSSPKLLEIANLIQDVGKQIAQQSMNVTMAISRTGNIPQDSVAELTETLLSSMQQLYERSAQINPLLFTIETETREGLAAVDSGRQKLANGTDAVKDVRQKLEQITHAHVNMSSLVEQITRAAENQIQLSTSARESVQEVANLANQISKHSLAITESFNLLAALAQKL